MAKAYTPGLKVTPRISFRSRRLLPIPGRVLVSPGERVAHDRIVAETFMEGDVTPFNVASKLGCTPAEVPSLLLKREGEAVAAGEVIGRSKGIFGMFKSECRAPAAGTLETVSSTTGQVLIRGEPIPVRVRAYLDGVVGEVVEGEGCVVEAEAALVQGIFGIGGETAGPIAMACKDPAEELHADLIAPEHRGCVVVGGARMTVAALRRAIEVGAAAVVSGGLDDSDLRELLGHDLGVAITGSERIGTTVVVTEGFGEIAMAKRTFDLLAANRGRVASVNGATQIRAGVMRPEIVVPLDASLGREAAAAKASEGVLELGSLVRIIRDPHFGVIGTVATLPPEPQVLGSGSKSRVLGVLLADGETVVVPRANVELIEG
jgi:hypothetical protein